ncbi:hypothetical protein [Nocardioides hwasunensis]|uniref:TPM domain-containing protein n=1 Tax=Nocardioides hwasunensis TaxID=397258 RepID=A0ABR8MIW3_9ACTN|nr:hypothetical protein [Nocardioides hwasunensis]MBD3915006.1 hypothetical protein [Nocardioides hwasunensis]
MDGPTDIDALADALREDGVVIDRVMGSGEAEQAHDRIAALVREVPFPVYVALVEQPQELPSGDRIAATEAFAGLLNRRLGDGLYVVDTTGGIQQVFAFGLDADAARVSLGASSNKDLLDETMQEVGGYARGSERYLSPPAVATAEAQVLAAEELVEMARDGAGSDYPATLTDADAEQLATYAVGVQAAAQWRPRTGSYVEVRNAQRGLSALVGGLAALAVALLLGQTLRGWPRRARPGPDRSPGKAVAAPPPDPETERRRATELSDELAAALERTDWEALEDRDVAGRALTARDAVERLLSSRDVADLIGAQVVARGGARDLARGRRGRSGAPLRTCFFDPRHPESRATVSWRLGDGAVEVPCCTACATTVRKGRVPEHLQLKARRGTVPYWERDDVWARAGFGAISDDLARDVLADRAGKR